MNNSTNLVVEGIYYILTALMALFSVFGIYILVRYGRTLAFALALGIIYGLFFLIILSQSYQTLKLLLN